MKVQQLQFSREQWWISSDSDEENWKINILEKSQLTFAFWSAALISQENTYAELRQYYPHSDIILTSTAGEIYWNEVYDDTISVISFEFQATKTQVVSTQIENLEESYEKWKDIISQLDLQDLSYVMVFLEWIKVNGSNLIEGIKSWLPDGVWMSGGLAGDGANFQETFVALNSVPWEQKNIICVGFYGNNIEIWSGSVGGWDVFWPKRLVTKSNESTVYELDNKPILDLYELYLGDLAQELPGSGLLFPLAVTFKNEDIPLVRTLLSIDRDNKSVTFAGNVPQWCYAQLMKANFDRLIIWSLNAAEFSKRSIEKPQAAILISCIWRKLVLKQRISEEVETIQDFLGLNCLISGFYSYGEIWPSMDIKDCQLHNQTMTVTLITEK